MLLLFLLPLVILNRPIKWKKVKKNQQLKIILKCFVENIKNISIYNKLGHYLYLNRLKKKEIDQSKKKDSHFNMFSIFSNHIELVFSLRTQILFYTYSLF